MKPRDAIQRLTQWDELNFLLTNRIPRRWATLLVGRLARVRQPWVFRASMAAWRLFSDLDLSEAQASGFECVHDCFTRQLKPGVRPIDFHPNIIASPCDGILGTFGPIVDGLMLQAKGLSYALVDLLGDARLAAEFRNGTYATLRLTSGMYHRFHAPYDCRVQSVTYFSGDTWNVNPPALARIERLYCRNERAVIACRLTDGRPLLLVPIAAILVASIRLSFVDVRLHLRYRGPNRIACDVGLGKGEEMGWFEHGSTVIVLAPAGVRPVPDAATGWRVRMGQALLEM